MGIRLKFNPEDRATYIEVTLPTDIPKEKITAIWQRMCEPGDDPEGFEISDSSQKQLNERRIFVRKYDAESLNEDDQAIGPDGSLRNDGYSINQVYQRAIKILSSSLPGKSIEFDTTKLRAYREERLRVDPDNRPFVIPAHLRLEHIDEALELIKDTELAQMPPTAKKKSVWSTLASPFIAFWNWFKKLFK